MKNIRLGDLLIELGYITPDQLTAALAYQKEHRDLRVGQALQELGYVNERQVLEALAKLIPNKIRIPKPSRESLQRKDFCIKTSG